MPQFQSTTTGAPCWVDLFSSDTDKAEEFYGQLFGWTAESAGEEYGGYINFAKDGQLVAGCMRSDGTAGMPDQWSVYLATTDAEATAEAVQAHGGSVVVAPMQVMDKGTMAMFEPGAPGWFELHTRDYAKTVQFYRDAFGWDTHVASDTDDFRYTTLGEGENQQAGIMDIAGFPAEEFPVGWSIYFVAHDADATIAKAVELGGAVVRPAEDSPFGRLATLSDPTGAQFKIVANG